MKGSGVGIDPILRKSGEQEAAFYRQAAPITPAGLLPRCYDVQVTEAGIELLLEDLSDTHMIVTVWPVPPQRRGLRADRGHLGGLPRLLVAAPAARSRGRGVRPTRPAVAWVANERRKRYAGFAEHLGDRLAAGPRALYDRVLDTLDRRITPALLRQHCTIVNGDAHVWNLLYPRDASAGSVRLIDWSNWRVGRGVGDIAYMMAVHWYPERRARLETSLLDRYHAGLCAGGVSTQPRAAPARHPWAVVALC